MSHELVHVATDANRTPMETWLLEGFADYVALRDTRLPDRVTLGPGDRRRAARRGAAAAADGGRLFATSAPDLQARYEEAWLACRVVAERLGESGLLGVYGRAARGEPLGEALRQGGLTPARLLTEMALQAGRGDPLRAPRRRRSGTWRPTGVVSSADGSRAVEDPAGDEEQVAHREPERRDSRHDHDRDQSHHECVLHRGGARSSRCSSSCDHQAIVSLLWIRSAGRSAGTAEGRRRRS